MKTPYKSKAGTLMAFLKGSKKYFFAGIISIFIVSLLEMINPGIIRFTVDSIIGEEPPELNGALLALYEGLGGRAYFRINIGLIALAVVVISLLAVTFRYIYRVMISKGTETFVERIRNVIYGKIQTMPYATLNERMTGDLIQRCTSDVNTVSRFVSDQLVSLFRIVVMLILSIWFMARMNVRLTLIASVFIPVIIIYSVLFRLKIEKMFRECDEEEGVLSTIVQENLTGVRVVRAFGRESYELERFHYRNSHYKDTWMKLSRLMAFFWNIGDLMSALQIMVVVIFGTIFCVRGSLTAGELIAFISYNSMLIWPVRQLGRTISEMSKAGVSIGRIHEILLSPSEQGPDEPLAANMRGDIVFDHVSFSYVDGTNVLDDVSFTIKSGTTIGVLGSTGSGKSTLAYLMTRLYEPQSGAITIDGVPLNKISYQEIRKNIGVVLQEPFLFSRTLGENISVVKPDMSSEMFKDAVSIAHLDETVEKLQNGFDTVVGERGVTLSGGQKQRVAIARMLTQDPPVMIFDDSLSAVDTETDVKIRQALKSSNRNRTMVLISHRITTLMDADYIIVLDKGKIVEAGTHSELVTAEGIYKKIYEIQNMNAEEVGK